jgi:Ca2+/Na+ antiporter
MVIAIGGPMAYLAMLLLFSGALYSWTKSKLKSRIRVFGFVQLGFLLFLYLFSDTAVRQIVLEDSYIELRARSFHFQVSFMLLCLILSLVGLTVRREKQKGAVL